MIAVKDGGAAFPVITEIVVGHDEWGNEVTNEIRSTGGSVSVRDYFAAKAMAALIISCADKTFITRNDECAEAYNYADAMLRAREVQS